MNGNSSGTESLRVAKSSSLVEQSIPNGSEGFANDLLFFVDVVEQHLLSDDPGQWKNLSTTDKDYLIEKGPARISKYFNYPVNSQTQGKFNNNLIYCTLNDRKKVYHNWLVYSISKDAVYCFPCKLFSSSTKFSTTGCSNWIYLVKNTSNHEKSQDHFILCISF